MLIYNSPYADTPSNSIQQYLEATSLQDPLLAWKDLDQLMRPFGVVAHAHAVAGVPQPPVIVGRDEYLAVLQFCAAQPSLWQAYDPVTTPQLIAVAVNLLQTATMHANLARHLEDHPLLALHATAAEGMNHLQAAANHTKNPAAITAHCQAVQVCLPILHNWLIEKQAITTHASRIRLCFRHFFHLFATSNKKTAGAVDNGATQIALRVLDNLPPWDGDDSTAAQALLRILSSPAANPGISAQLVQSYWDNYLSAVQQALADAAVHRRKKNIVRIPTWMTDTLRSMTDMPGITTLLAQHDALQHLSDNDDEADAVLLGCEPDPADAATYMNDPDEELEAAADNDLGELADYLAGNDTVMRRIELYDDCHLLTDRRILGPSELQALFQALLHNGIIGVPPASSQEAAMQLEILHICGIQLPIVNLLRFLPAGKAVPDTGIYLQPRKQDQERILTVAYHQAAGSTPPTGQPLRPVSPTCRFVLPVSAATMKMLLARGDATAWSPDTLVFTITRTFRWEAILDQVFGCAFAAYRAMPVLHRTAWHNLLQTVPEEVLLHTSAYTYVRGAIPARYTWLSLADLSEALLHRARRQLPPLLGILKTDLPDYQIPQRWHKIGVGSDKSIEPEAIVAAFREVEQHAAQLLTRHHKQIPAQEAATVFHTLRLASTAAADLSIAARDRTEDLAIPLTGLRKPARALRDKRTRHSQEERVAFSIDWSRRLTMLLQELEQHIPTSLHPAPLPYAQQRRQFLLSLGIELGDGAKTNHLRHTAKTECLRHLPPRQWPLAQLLLGHFRTGRSLHQSHISMPIATSCSRAATALNTAFPVHQ